MCRSITWAVAVPIEQLSTSTACADCATMDAYGLLGVARTATTEEVRNAYKEKAMLHHPDRGGSPATWATIQKAYDTLSDPQRRAAHDQSRAAEGGAAKQFGESFAEASSAYAPRKTVNISSAMEVAKKEDPKGQLTPALSNLQLTSHHPANPLLHGSPSSRSFPLIYF